MWLESGFFTPFVTFLDCPNRTCLDQLHSTIGYSACPYSDSFTTIYLYAWYFCFLPHFPWWRDTMKTLGLLGGMSWESTVTYYQEINRRVRQVKGGLHSARCIVFSFDFAEIEELQHAGKWDEAGLLLDEAAVKLKLAGAEGIVLCSNTMHFISLNIESASQLPLIHIVDPTARAILKKGYKCVGLLGTRFTMEKDFYKARLTEEFGLRVIVPEEEGRATVHDVIYTELCNGIINETSREKYYKIIADLKKAGADCLILGCTEIGLLVDEGGSELPVFDTAHIHAIAAADWAMGIEGRKENKSLIL